MYLPKSYRITPESTPPYPRSDLIEEVRLHPARYHSGVGDMWPITWGWDGNLYAGAGDNQESPMNFWRIQQEPDPNRAMENNCWTIETIHNMPVDPVTYCRSPNVDGTHGVKPASLIDLGGCLYFAVELMNYGFPGPFSRQENVSGWIITSRDYGKTWNLNATPVDFFTGRLSSIHFVQQGGPGNRWAEEDYLYATFPCGRDGGSYWENGDCLLLGRVPQRHILDRDCWEFYTGLHDGVPVWSKDDGQAAEIFSYPHMCGEDHISYNRELGRYILGNYSFLDLQGNPFPHNHGNPAADADRSQLTLFEAEHLWGPWKLFYQDDNWGSYGDYQPCFPQKWMYHQGKTMYMVSSGLFDDYNFTVQRMDLVLKDDKNRK